MKNSSKYLEKIYHIKREIEYLNKTSNSLLFSNFISNETLKRAFVRSLTVIGEAVKAIPNEIKKKYEDIEWNRIAGMRDILIHQYFGVDYDIVWDVLKNKIPILEKTINRLFSEENKRND